MSYMKWLSAEDLVTRYPDQERLFWLSVEICGSIDTVTPLASLHANPAHSALRRARHFELAYQRIYEDYDAFSRMTWRDDFCWQYDDALAGACDSSHAAFHAQMWSVR